MTNAAYWEQRYQEQSDRWDLGEAAPPFVALLNAPSSPSPGKVAVIGCGRGHDALLFARHGFEVTGFDFSPTAIADATRQAASLDLPAQFLQRNIFDLAEEFPAGFDYVIEHTCFCAIAPAQRQAYVKLVHSILRPGGELIALFWGHDRPGGPPFGVSLQEIADLFASKFDVSVINPATNSIESRRGEEYLACFRAFAATD
ncbi:MAG TPA: methyltransferase domain-containing protein [Leptolyngbya sp.]|jgi:SAM-dependent methyltransferase|nr:methyltransferase domain-containing protein [Leptolyngbya sp.]